MRFLEALAAVDSASDQQATASETPHLSGEIVTAADRLVDSWYLGKVSDSAVQTSSDVTGIVEAEAQIFFTRFKWSSRSIGLILPYLLRKIDKICQKFDATLPTRSYSRSFL